VAFVLMLLSSIYIEKFFTTPKDSIANSVNTLLIGVTIYLNNDYTKENYWLIFTYVLFVFLPSMFFLLTYEKHRKINFILKYSSNIGKAKVIFPIAALLSFTKISYAGSTFDLNIEKEKLIILVVFYLICLIFLNKWSIDLVNKLINKLFGKTENFGKIRSNHEPNILIIEFSKKSGVKINDLVAVGGLLKDEKNKFNIENEKRLGIVLDFVGGAIEDDFVLTRIYLLSEPQRNLNSSHSGLSNLTDECLLVPNPDEVISKVTSLKIKYYWERRNDIIALVSSFTNINILKADIVKHQQLENAQLISVVNNFPSRLIRYQIIEAENQLENTKERKDYGYTKMDAYQLGEWRKPKNENGEEDLNRLRQFFEFQWVPQVNSPIMKWNKDYDEINIEEGNVDLNGYFLLGNVPKTNLKIYLNLKDLVSHHTAILGVTGSGKTTLVFKLLKEINETGVFIICLDITGEYKDKIIDHEDFINDDFKSKYKEALNILKEDDKQKKVDEVVKERINELKVLKKITILEMLEISNTKSSLDFTQYLIHSILKYGKDIYDMNLGKKENEKDKFQCCLVLEEAHTLVPENLGIGGDYGASTAVLNKICQIALQGRKYNVGFLLISQRTATVKKTVLNQCNTMIAFRAYDETSYNFLQSYFGNEYVQEIAHLKNDGDSRYVIAAGKAVVADRPVIVEVKK